MDKENNFYEQMETRSKQEVCQNKCTEEENQSRDAKYCLHDEAVRKVGDLKMIRSGLQRKCFSQHDDDSSESLSLIPPLGPVGQLRQAIADPAGRVW